jgi:hypothetical protein
MPPAASDIRVLTEADARSGARAKQSVSSGTQCVSCPQNLDEISGYRHQQEGADSQGQRVITIR